MFEIPDAKRVRREDLYDSSSSAGGGSDGEGDGRDEEADAVLRNKLNARLASLLDLDLGLSSSVAEGASRKETMHSQPGGSQQRRQRNDDSADDDDDDDARDQIMKDDDDEVEQVQEEEEPIEFAFRLFSGEDPSHKVVLDKQDDKAEGGVTGDGGGFVVARRPTSYYLAQQPSAETADRLRAAALSYESILADAGRRRWGIEKPWKVTTITVTATKTKAKTKKGKSLSSAAAGEEGFGESRRPSGPPAPPGGSGSVQGVITGIVAEGSSVPAGKRTRPGKKRRIILRTREKTKKEKEMAAKKQAVDKEQHLLEKKKRLNRQKKLKRRAKAKEQKKQGDGADGDDHDDDDEDDDKSVASG